MQAFSSQIRYNNYNHLILKFSQNDLGTCLIVFLGVMTNVSLIKLNFLLNKIEEGKKLMSITVHHR